MELEVGMYVRTKRRTFQPPQIARIRDMSKDVVLNQYFIELDKNLIPSYKHHIYEEDIENANHSLIELVKVGDYVNGYPIYEIIEYEDNTRAIVIGDDNKSIIWEESSQYIKSIVTKEQFEAMAYRVGE